MPKLANMPGAGLGKMEKFIQQVYENTSLSQLSLRTSAAKNTCTYDCICILPRNPPLRIFVSFCTHFSAFLSPPPRNPENFCIIFAMFPNLPLGILISFGTNFPICPSPPCFSQSPRDFDQFWYKSPNFS